MLNKNKNKIMSTHKEYEFLKADGVLLKLFPELSGEWVDDKKVFTQMWDLNNNALKDLDVIIDDEE